MEQFLKAHWNKDREWKYDLQNRRMRTYHEMVDRRNLNFDPVKSMHELVMPSDDLLLEQRQLKDKQTRMKMAKYNKGLLDQIILEMTNTGKSQIEIMSELDIKEKDIQESLLRSQIKRGDPDTK